MNRRVLETSIECSLTEKSHNFSKNPTSKSWVNNLDSQVKYHERLMKPLKTNPKLKRAATVAKASENLYEERVLDPEELGLSKLMNKVKEIAKISKHHRKLVKDEGKEPGLAEENVLASKLSDKTYNYIKIVQAANEPDQHASILSETKEQSNAEKQELQRERNNKIARQMSRTNIIPKQLNTNVHFRHAKRKILVLRTFDSIPNRRETLRGLMEDVEKKKEEEPNLVRMKSVEIPPVLASPPISKKFMHAKTMNTIGDSLNKPKKLHLQNFLESSTVSIFGSPKNEEETLPKSQNILQIKTICSEESFEGDLPCIQKKKQNVLRIPSLAQVSSIIMEEGQKTSTSRSIVLTSRKGYQIADAEKECRQYLKEYYPSNRMDTLNFLDDESLLLKGAVSSRSGAGKNKPRPEYTVPKQSKALKDELILNLREDNLKIEDRLLILKSKKTRHGNRKITSTKHLRNIPGPGGCSVIQPSKPSKNLRGRGMGIGDQKQTSNKNLMNNNSELNLTTIKNLIEKSYEGEKPNQEDTQTTILKSYGFHDTIGRILKPKNNNKFSVLEGYQGEYLKGEIAKVQRQIDASLRKSQKSLVIL